MQASKSGPNYSIFCVEKPQSVVTVSKSHDLQEASEVKNNEILRLCGWVSKRSGGGWGGAWGWGGALYPLSLFFWLTINPWAPWWRLGGGSPYSLKNYSHWSVMLQFFYLNCINSRHKFLCCNLSSLWNRLPNLDQTTPSFVWNSHSSLSWR